MPYYKRKRLQARITAGHWTLPVAILIALTGWLAAWLLLPDAAFSPAGVLLCGFTGYLLVWLNNAFALIRMRASVQTAAYLLLTATCPRLFASWQTEGAALAFLLSLFFLFKSYQQQNPTGDLFHSFLFVGVGSLCLPELTWVVPLLWIGAYRFQSLSVRSFLASLLGWSLPYWLLFGYAYGVDRMELFHEPLRQLVTIAPFTFRFEPWLLATGGYLLVLFIVCATHCIVAGYEDKLRTRSYLNFLVLLCIYLFAWTLLRPEMGAELLAVLLPALSVLAGHFFMLTHGRWSNIFFLLMFALLVPLFIFNVWTLL